MTSFTNPGTVYRFDFEKGGEGEQEEEAFRKTEVKGIEPESFVTEQVFYESKDGTKVPMFVTRLARCVPRLLYAFRWWLTIWRVG